MDTDKAKKFITLNEPVFILNVTRFLSRRKYKKILVSLLSIKNLSA